MRGRNRGENQTHHQNEKKNDRNQYEENYHSVHEQWKHLKENRGLPEPCGQGINRRKEVVQDLVRQRPEI